MKRVIQIEATDKGELLSVKANFKEAYLYLDLLRKAVGLGQYGSIDRCERVTVTDEHVK